ncbi:MAG: iron-containing alcohol dehydrogenase, partial [Alphaproteobacteria bacterium]|nr:iron-containing alcohol dehydrogenase [Alphaproteobacteria bacterium]
GYHPMAQGIAVEGMNLIKQSLVAACKDGSDLVARTNMMAASCMGATAFQKGLGGMHALAHTLGGLYDSHHGLLNAILMPYVLKANESVISESIAHLARCLDLEEHSFDGFMKWVIDLREAVGIPHTLADIKIDTAQSAKVGEMSVVDPAAGGNPISFTAEEYSKVFENAVNGVL